MSRAKEAAEPLKRWWQSKQSSSPTDYFTSQEQDIPGGHVSHTEESHQSSGQGTTNTSSAQHETSSWSNDNNSYDSGYQQGNQLQQQRQPVGTLCLAQQLLCVMKLAACLHAVCLRHIVITVINKGCTKRICYSCPVKALVQACCHACKAALDYPVYTLHCNIGCDPCRVILLTTSQGPVTVKVNQTLWKVMPRKLGWRKHAGELAAFTD